MTIADFAAKTPRITYAEEIELTRQLHAATPITAAYKEWEEAFECPPTMAEWAEYVGIPVTQLTDTVNKASKAREKLITSNMRLVYKIANKYKNIYSSTFNDVLQEGMYGLIKGIERFDPSKGYRLGTYIYWWIHKEIKEYMRTNQFITSFPNSASRQVTAIKRAMLALSIANQPKNVSIISEKSGVCEKAVEAIIPNLCEPMRLNAICATNCIAGGNPTEYSNIVPSREPALDVVVEQEDTKESLLRLLRSVLSETEYHIVTQKFGIDADEQNFAEIANQLGISTVEAVKIKRQAFKKLRQPNNAYLLKELAA